MIVSYQGGESFKISQGNLNLVMNPKAKTSADVTLFSQASSETSEKSGFVITGPGEYEVKDISIKGFLSEGTGKKINTIYMVGFEGMNLCFLGSLNNATLTDDILEQLENIDILFLPIDTLDPTSAYKLAVSLEPSLIVPMLYTGESLKKFLKEAGENSPSTESKLVIKKKDLEGKEGEIMVLTQE